MKNLRLLKFNKPSNQLEWLLNEIIKYKNNGSDLSKIAIITRKHKKLEAVALELNKNKIAINYQREIDLLKVERVDQIITLLYLINNFYNSDYTNIHLLPEILAYPFVGMKPDEIYRFSSWLKINKKSWFEGLSVYSENTFQSLYKTLLNLSILAKTLPVECILDFILNLQTIPGMEKDEIYTFKIINISTKVENTIANSEDLELISHIKNLKNIIKQEKADLKLNGFLEIINIYKESGLKIHSTGITSKEGINLITAHACKGLEFEKVILIDCNANDWSNKNNDIIKLPIFLPVSKSFETADDIMRLFYVATTRAKKELIITSYDFNNLGKAIKPLPFLAEKDWETLEDNITESSKEGFQVNINQLSSDLNIAIDIKNKLQPEMERYELSFTHLWNFIDVENGGPEGFFKYNILRFPTSDNIYSKFGSSIHKTFDIAQKNWQKQDKKPTLNEFIKIFENEFLKEKILAEDREIYLKKGRKVLSNYFQKNVNWNKDWQTEVVYKNIAFEKTLLKGSLDRLSKLEDGSWLVSDLKTGKPLQNFIATGNDYKSLKSFKYEMQLEFYKILFENATNKKLSKGSIIFLEDEYMELETDLNNKFDFLPKLVEKVYYNIQNFKFPDTENYSPDLNGIKDFISELTN